jgi:small subunit ribosomal protein S20
MPVTESAKKALRNAEAKRARNTLIKAELKRVLKNANLENLSQVVSFVDKAAKRDIIHPNKAARIKSSLSKMTPESLEAKSTKTKKKTTKAKKTTKKA